MRGDRQPPCFLSAPPSTWYSRPWFVAESSFSSIPHVRLLFSVPSCRPQQKSLCEAVYPFNESKHRAEQKVEDDAKDGRIHLVSEMKIGMKQSDC